MFQHPGQEVNSAEAGGLLADDAAAVGQALASKSAALRLSGEPLVLAIEIADLPGAHTDVTGGDVGVCADQTVQGCHEALAEAHDLPAALAPGIKIRAAGGAADRQPRQGVFVGLLKAQELHDRGVDGGMEPQPTLVGADGAVELHPVAVVGVGHALIVHPGHSEGQHSIRLHHSGQQVHPLIDGIVLQGRGNHLQPGENGLEILRLAGVPLLEVGGHAGNIVAHADALLRPNRRPAWRQPLSGSRRCWRRPPGRRACRTGRRRPRRCDKGWS